jgi:hypothetical protein
MNMENNDSRLIYVPKGEFVRVISGIINGSSEANGEDTNLRTRSKKNDDDYLDSDKLYSSDRDKVVRRDSFYFLQRTLESRAAGKKTPDFNTTGSDTPTSRRSSGGASTKSRTRDGKLTPSTRLSNIM